MNDSYLNLSGYRVDLGTWILYDSAPSSSPLTLTGTAPAVAFRCRATVASTGTHTDCSGTLTIGSETFTFTTSGQVKITTTNLSSLPVVAYSGLDCKITIEALNSGGQVLQEETQTALDCDFRNSQKSFKLPSGEMTMSDAIAYVNDSSCVIGTKFSYGGYDYGIAQTYDETFEGDVIIKLWLTGKTAAPTGRTVVVETQTVTTSQYMLKSVYDTDSDGVADKAEGIPVLAELPSDLSGYSVGDQFMVGNKKYTITDE